MNLQRLLIPAVALFAASAAALPAHAGVAVIGGGGFTPVTHVTDGQFTGDEWGSDTNASKSFFPVVGNSGGAWLYVAQGSVPGQTGNLYLMYDWINSPTLGFDPTKGPTFFDVFFQVKDNDYVAAFGTKVDASSPTGFDQTALSVFEKLGSVVSPLNPDGSLKLSSPPWTLLNPPGGPNDADFTNGKFQAAVGFGTSPNSPSTNHLMGELQMTIDTTKFGTPSNGLYSPDPAFWGADAFNSEADLSGAVGPPEGDPPITSGIFTLNPDGTTTLNPLFSPNGAPVQQPQDLVPEPSSLMLCGIAGLSLVGYARKRKKAAA